MPTIVAVMAVALRLEPFRPKVVGGVLVASLGVVLVVAARGTGFGQATMAQRPFLADRFASVHMTDEPLDAVVFSDGLVAPGEMVTVSAMITDYTPRDEFFLLQRRESPIAALPLARPGG